MTTWQEEQLAMYTKLANDLNVISGYEFRVENKNDYYNVVLNYAGAKIVVRESTYGQKDYSFFLDSNNFPYVNYDKESVIKALGGTPNKIHTLNPNAKKRVIEWVNFLVKVNQELTKLSIEKSERVEKFLAKAQAEGVSVREDSTKNGYNGRASRNGIEYSFTIEAGSGYIREEVKIDYSLRSLEHFLQLSDNKFVSQKS